MPPCTRLSFHERHICSFSIFVSPTSSKTKGTCANGQQAREGQGQREDVDRLIQTLNEQVECYSRNEEQRKQNEEQRKQNEELRKQNEEQRKQSEEHRIENEKQRRENEAQRIENEKQRGANDEQRSENEKQRRENENHRREDERQRSYIAMQGNPGFAMHRRDQSPIQTTLISLLDCASEYRHLHS